MYWRIKRFQSLTAEKFTIALPVTTTWPSLEKMAPPAFAAPESLLFVTVTFAWPARIAPPATGSSTRVNYPPRSPRSRMCSIGTRSSVA